MTQSFTLNQCTRHLYGETTLEESNFLSDIISGNPRVGNEYAQMKAAKTLLDSYSQTPAQASLDAVMRHSKKCQLSVSH